MIIEDESKVEEVLDTLHELSSKTIEIGILEKDMKQNHNGSKSATLGDIATVHEFGFMGTDKKGRSMNIPERSFIRASFDQHKGDVVNKGEKYLSDVVGLKVPADTFFKAIGTQGVTYVQRYIKSMTTPPLQKETIKAKGSSKLLRDTGALIGSIDFEVK